MGIGEEEIDHLRKLGGKCSVKVVTRSGSFAVKLWEVCGLSCDRFGLSCDSRLPEGRLAWALREASWLEVQQPDKPGWKSWLSCDSSGVEVDPVYTWGGNPG